MRIRTIKPEFWRSLDVADLSWEDRLLFIGLWAYVDDNGVGRDEPRLIHADLFPFDDFEETAERVHAGLRRLHAQGLIMRYTANSQPYVFITSWSQHQKIARPQKARYPRPDAENPTLKNPGHADCSTPHADCSNFSARNRGTGEQGNRGTGEQGNRGTGDESEVGTGDSPAPDARDQGADAPPKTKRGTRLPDDWAPTPELESWAVNKRPDLDVREEIEKFCDYWHSKAGASATKVNWELTFRNWIRNARPSRRTNSGGSAYYDLAAQYAREGR